MNLAATNQAG